MDAKQQPIPRDEVAIGIGKVYGATLSVSFSHSEAPEVRRAILARLRTVLQQLPAKSPPQGEILSPRDPDALFWSWAGK